MRYIFDKNILHGHIKALWKRGGLYQKAAEKVKEILGAITMGELDVLKKISTTNNGESRIKNCVKYDLQGFCRLVTIQENNVCAFVFLGTHEECDKWLDNNKGMTLILDENNSVISMNLSADIHSIENVRKVESKISDSNLIEKLKESYSTVISDLITGTIFRKIEKFDSFTDEDEIFEVCMLIPDSEIKELILDVLLELKADNVDQAKNRIKLFEETYQKVSTASEDEIKTIVSNDEFITLEDFSGKDIENLMKGSSWYDWMLFMHPQQRVVVERDFNGPARLLGVSGSGKTCVVVNRAIRLAKKYSGEKILITTINQALSSLIKQLISVALNAEQNKEELLSSIHVMSFWELSRQLLLENEKDKIYRRSYNVFSDTHLEDVDSVWCEFYFKENNNTDAEILTPVHQSLLNRNVLPIEYIKQEFDWIRSALNLEERSAYLNIERVGRSEAFSPDFRKIILEGLQFWESKMNAVGVCDYLGLIGPLSKFSDKITPRYRSILVDELQDFGTTELSILRKLVAHNENDLFLCGDIAQQVHSKHQMISKAGIQIIPNNYLKIVKNYRNSREILEAASIVFHNNVKPEQYNNKEFELLNPEFANFSSPKPFIRAAKNLDSEFNFSFNYLKQILSHNEKGCIAFCGLSYFQVKSIGASYNLAVLDGESSIDNANIFISDLDQTKGFEFDRMIIINCSNDIFPNPRLPHNEWFREISKLYVAMTRAKKELIITYSNTLSHVFNDLDQYFTIGTKWLDYLDPSKLINTIAFSKSNDSQVSSSLLCTGLEYLYTVNAVGLSGSAQDKILSIVTGRAVLSKGVPEECKTISDFIAMLKNNRIKPQVTRLIGASTILELKEHFTIL